MIDGTARAVAPLRFSENELKRQAEAGASDDYRRRVAKILRDVRANRERALSARNAVGEQGTGFGPAPTGPWVHAGGQIFCSSPRISNLPTRPGGVLFPLPREASC